MVILTIESLSKSYGPDVLLDDVSFGISSEDCVGIVGANGVGKTTLLRIIANLEPMDEGRRSVNKEAHIEYLAQRPSLDPELSALRQVLHDGPEAFGVVQAYEAACVALEADPMSEDALVRMSKLAEDMDRVGGWSIEAEAKAALSGLGILDIHQKVGTMSGGQRKRVALARALTRPSSLLILDEPTNHLDVETVDWLEQMLITRQGALLLVTHDRYFLDRVANTIFEIAEQKVFRHAGNYSAFVAARAERDVIAQKRESRRAQLAKKELAWLRKSPKARTTKSKSRVDRAHELLNTSYKVHTSELAIDATSQRLGKKILEVEHLTKSFEGRCVLKDFSYVFRKRERVGIIGPNGSGKSTMLNLFTGRLEQDSGTIEVGDTVVFGYYDQESQELDESMRVHDYISSISNHIETSQGALSASQMLERFLFSPKRQFGPISKLSGGERRRLYLLRVLMDQPNFLLLDEPTNDLDVETLTVLEDFLDTYQGVLVVVSHDRYFLDRTVEHLLVYGEGGLIEEFPGAYTHWREAMAAQRQGKAKAILSEPKSSEPKSSISSTSSVSSRSGKLSYKEQRELDGLRVCIEQLETRAQEIDEEMVLRVSDYTHLSELQEEKDRVDVALEEALERWMVLEDQSS